MATIVRHKGSGKSYLLIGSGFGVDRDKRGLFDGKPAGHVELRYHDMLCCANQGGEIGWFKSCDLQVVSVDGVPVADYPIAPASGTQFAGEESAAPGDTPFAET